MMIVKDFSFKRDFLKHSNKSEINLHIEGRVSDAATEAALAAAALVSRVAKFSGIPEDAMLGLIMTKAAEALEVMKKGNA